MTRRFEDFFGRPFLPASWCGFPSEAMAWSPAVAVLEKEDKFVVKVELPGVKEENVDVSVAGDVLTISGEKRAESGIKKKEYYCGESSHGSFPRSTTMPYVEIANDSPLQASSSRAV